MKLKELAPANLIAAARLARTFGTLYGFYDSKERRQRLITLDQLRRQVPKPGNSKRVLFFSFRGWHTHVAWESLLAHALRLRGTTVHVFSCGGYLPICEVNFRHASPILSCTECAAYPRQLLSALNLPHSWLCEYLTAAEQSEIEGLVNELEPDEFEGWVFHGQPIGKLVRDSVLWFLRKSKPDLRGPDAKVYRDFLISGGHIAVLAPRLLAATRPDVVVELNGQFFAERILNRFAGNSTAVVAYEAGWRSNTLGFDAVSDAGPIDLDSVWASYAHSLLTQRENDELDNWIKGRSAGDMERDFYIRFNKQDRQHPLRRLNLSPDLPTAVLFTNLVWDTAVLNRDLAFPSTHDWLSATVRLFGHWRDRQLIIRIHPAEDLRPSVESREKMADVIESLGPLPENVRVVPAKQQLSSYRLMDSCQLGLVYTSTTGLEMALHGKPVVVAARVYYRGRGFTCDVSRASDYAGIISEAFKATTLSTEQMTLARRFAYLLLFRYLYKIPVVNQRPRQLPLLDPSETELLLPGALPELDQLLDAIEKGRDFVPLPCSVV